MSAWGWLFLMLAACSVSFIAGAVLGASAYDVDLNDEEPPDDKTD